VPITASSALIIKTRVSSASAATIYRPNRCAQVALAWLTPPPLTFDACVTLGTCPRPITERRRYPVPGYRFNEKQKANSAPAARHLLGGARARLSREMFAVIKLFD